jgi:hypothetical protein
MVSSWKEEKDPGAIVIVIEINAVKRVLLEIDTT